jgi:putative hydrolase of the HAD superfamily
MIDLKGINTIIFDLGGVILNIDYIKTANCFKELGIINYNELYTQFNQISIFDDLEMGKISPNGFRKKIKELSKINLNNSDIDMAWNAMLLDFPKERLELLKKLKNKFRLFLLSNTNEIHLINYEAQLKQKFNINNLSEFFEKEYYSHQMGMRKPNKDIFIKVLSDNNLIASETLFIDDSPQHILGAKSVGINAYHLTNNETIIDVFSKKI